MLQISADLTVLSQSQREALADFITTFPGKISTDDPIRACPKVEVDPAFFTPEEQAEEPLPVFDAPLPAGVEFAASFEHFNPAPVTAKTIIFPAGGPSQVDPPANLDKHGLPWDDRIHAGSKARNADGSWRYKRGVESRLVDQVEGELRAVMGLQVPAATFIPPPPAVPAAAAVPSITPSPVVSAPTVVPAVPPAPAGLNPFVSLITFAGAKNMEGKLTDAEIAAACNSVGVTSIPLMTNRHDLCPYVEASLRQLVASR